MSSTTLDGSSSNNKESVLKSLEELEDRLSQILEVASTAFVHVSSKNDGGDNFSQFQRHSKEFTSLVRGLHTALVNQSHLVENYKRMRKSDYSAAARLKRTQQQIQELSLLLQASVANQGNEITPSVDPSSAIDTEDS